MSKINYNDLIGQSTQFLGQQIDNVQRSLEQGVTGLGVAKGVFGGAAAGASMGTLFAPGVGTIIGGGIGALTGGITSAIGTGHGYNADSNSVRFADIYKPGSGIASLVGNSKGWARNRAAETQRNNIAKNLTGNVILDYYNDYRNVPLAYAAAEGGVIPSTLAYTDDGELGRLPNGQLFEEPEEGKPTDSNLRSLPVGTEIWSDKLKVPGEGITFADKGKKIVKKYEVKGTDKYAEATRGLNDKLMHKELDDLLALQDEVKMKKNKSKNGVPAYEGGKNSKEELNREIAARKMAQRSMDDYFVYRKKDGTFVMQDIDGVQYDVPDFMLPYIQGDEKGYWFGPTYGVAPNASKWNGSMNFAKQMLNAKNIAKLRNTMTKVLPKSAKSTPSTKALDIAKAEVATERAIAEQQRLMSQAWLRGKSTSNPYAGTTAGRDAASQGLWNLPNSATNADDILISEGIKSSMPYYLTLAGMLGGAATFLSSEYAKNNPEESDVATLRTHNVAEPNLPSDSPIIPQVKTESVESTGKTKNTTTSALRIPSRSVASSNSTTNIPSYAPFLSKKSAKDLLQRQNQYKNIESLNRISNIPEAVYTKDIPGFMEDYGETVRYERPSNINWEDLTYQTMSVLTPLTSKAKAKTTKLTRPRFTAAPVAIDTLNQELDVDRSFALANYNIDLGGYGAGQQLAAKVAAANDRATQKAKIKQWQTEAQNKNISQNVALYNAWQDKVADIANNETQLNEQNQSAANYINQQNRAQALRNWGSSLKNKKQFAMNDFGWEALRGLVDYAYENSDELRKKYKRIR